MEGTCKSFSTTGRPHLYLSGEKIARYPHSVGALIGPAHAFTPWTSMYAYCAGVADCYGSEPIDFLELGLSADSSYGATGWENHMQIVDPTATYTNEQARKIILNKWGPEVKVSPRQMATLRNGVQRYQREKSNWEFPRCSRAKLCTV